MNVHARTITGLEGVFADNPALMVIDAGRRLEVALNDALSGEGSSLARLAVLQAVTAGGSAVGLKDLAAVLGCSKSNASALVERMQRDRLLDRVVDPKDGRGVLLSLTPDGERVHRTGLGRVLERQEAMLGALTAEERDALVRLLAGIRP